MDPKWTDVVQAISLAATALVVIFSAGFARQQLLDSRRTRHAHLISELSKRWDAPELVEARDRLHNLTPDQLLELTRKVYEGNATAREREDFLSRQMLPNYMEVIAVIEEKVEDALPIEVVSALWGGAIKTTWACWEKTVTFLREQPDGEQAFISFEHLQERVSEYREAVKSELEAIEA